MNITLHNPTDDQLDACFAERVCGWKRGDGIHTVKEAWFAGEDCVAPITSYKESSLHFTRSADAVLPWLEKWEWRFMEWRGSFWYVAVERGNCNGSWMNLTGKTGEDKSLPRAAVIALLRAHGVTVTFD